MKDLTLDRFAGLVRTNNVHRVFLTPYPSIDGGGWFLDVDHDDHGMTRQIHAQRGGVRIFKTADAAIRALNESRYAGSVAVVMERQSQQ